ncbi:MAG TPA: hypothetical protein VMI31_10770, partial [Fimbriimonadaceae bacterium]|nr:hypothetical protein [Fimbriimonadaceae bacterium]
MNMALFRRFLLVLLSLSAVLGARAASVRADGASIYVNEIEVIKLRVPSGGRSPSERAAYLAPILQDDLAAGGLKVVKAGRNFRVVVGGKPWALVTADEAKASGSTPEGLAQQWCAAINSALALPAFKLAEHDLKIPAAGKRMISMVGGHARDVVVSVADPKVASAGLTGATLTVQGAAPGTTQLTLSYAAQTETVTVEVEPLAAYLPQTLTAYVTGTPASRDTVVGTVVEAVNNDLKSVEGAQVSFTPPAGVEIQTGESHSFLIHVRVAGPESFPSEGYVSVTVRNTPIGYREEADLWYSNDPEPVPKPMRLFAAALQADSPVRMLYHHINRSGSTMIMSVEAINNTDTPARVLIIPGDADPAQNPVQAGFEAADRFVLDWSRYSGEIVDVPPFSILPISLRRMHRNDTVSGLCYLRLLDGGPKQLVVCAETRRPSVVDHKWKAAMASATPWRVAGTKPIGDLASVPQPDAIHIYPNPFKQEKVTYKVGGPFGFVRIGQTPIARQDNRGSLDGNFGVIYTIDASIVNQTASPADVEVVYEASAGYGGALFLIDGALRTTPLLQPKEETRLTRIRLDPNSSKEIRI